MELMKRAGKCLVMAAVAATVAGCATMKHGANQRIPVTTQPPGAAITDNGEKVAYSPAEISLRSNQPHTIGFRLDGYADDQLMVRPQVSGWFWGNCLLFPYTPIGMITDWLNGSMYKLWPEKLNVTLRRSAAGIMGDEFRGASGGGKSTLAVADFTPQDVSAGNAAIIAELFRTEMVKAGSFDVVEKANMEKVLSEQAFQQTGCTSQECAVKLGKVLNVRYLVVGSFGKLMDSYILNVRMVDVQTAKVVYSDSSQGKDVPAVQTAIREMAAKLSGAAGGGR